MTTPEFIEALIKNEVNLEEKVLISAKELLALMTENIEATSEQNQRLANNTKEINKIKAALDESKKAYNSLSFAYAKLLSNYQQVVQQEKIQRDRANVAEDKLRSCSSSVKVTYSKGDLVDFCR